jgi:hypothetical protein
LEPTLKWSVREGREVMTVGLVGDVDENARLMEIVPVLRGPVVINLRSVRRINSAGVREWVNFIRAAAERVPDLTLVECSSAFVAQMNMIYNFRASAKVFSFYAPYVCSACEREQDRLVRADDPALVAKPDAAPAFVCEACGAALELDELPERYFAFLREG